MLQRLTCTARVYPAKSTESCNMRRTMAVMMMMMMMVMMTKCVSCQREPASGVTIRILIRGEDLAMISRG